VRAEGLLNVLMVHTSGSMMVVLVVVVFVLVIVWRARERNVKSKALMILSVFKSAWNINTSPFQDIQTTQTSGISSRQPSLLTLLGRGLNRLL
jgi:cytochrome c biogenesis factor